MKDETNEIRAENGRILYRTENIENQFDHRHRRHYWIEVTATDYDESGNNPDTRIIYSVKQHFTRKELEQFAEQLARNYIRSHHEIEVSARVEPFSLIWMMHTDEKGTESDEHGQIRFKI
jgi:hypothetical protein